ncbi:hypothetical protein [Methanobacterium sp.]|uniref:hypothetical protein n=1 Tax=Methanobacterium sp. TaxID=2164 RepID=UPI003C73BDAD
MNWTKQIINNGTLRSNIGLIMALMTFLILGIILIRYYQYQINPDGLVYIKIAKTYLMGNYSDAISTYWSPLISWLLVPFLIYSLNPVYVLFSTKLLALIIGFFTLLGIGKLSYKFEMDETIRTVILFSAVPVILYFAYSVITPDLVVVCILVYYFNIIFSSEYSSNIYNGLFCGSLGALAYLSKSYAFPFFIAHFTLFNIIHYFKNIQNRKKVLKNLFLGFIVFFVISGIWIGLISQKEGEITYGTSGEFNHNLVGPESKGWGVTHYLGEITQDESMTPSADVKSWSPFESWGYFKYQLKLIYTNTMATINIYRLFSCFSLIILFVYLILILNGFKKILTDNRIYPVLTIIIFSSGYLPILVEERYLWIIYPLLVLMGGYLLNELFKYSFFTGGRKGTSIKSIILLIFAVSFIWMPVSSLSENINSDKEIYNLANLIEDQYNVHGNIVINQDNKKISIAYLSYYMGTNYLGQTNNTGNSKMPEQLKKYNVDFYMVWGDNKSVLNGYTDVTNGKINILKIYSINDKVQMHK